MPDNHDYDTSFDHPTTTTLKCECGDWRDEGCGWVGPRTETVIVEWTPKYLRESHTAAGNRGQYSVNGAQRSRVSRDCADMMIEHDGEWCSEVPDGPAAHGQ